MVKAEILQTYLPETLGPGIWNLQKKMHEVWKGRVIHISPRGRQGEAACKIQLSEKCAGIPGCYFYGNEE